MSGLRRHRAAQTTQPAPTHTIQVHMKKVSAVAFFKDGRRIVTASESKTLGICDVEKGALVGGPFRGHSDYVCSVAVSPDDRRIASGGEDGAIIIWDVDSKQMIFKPLVKHRDRVSSVCFSPDGKRLASGSQDRRIIIWDAETRAILSIRQDGGWVNCVAFSPDGLKLASGTRGKIRVWRTDDAELLRRIHAHDDQVQSVVWSPDGQQLVSASDDQTVKFWNSSNWTQIGKPCTGHTDCINSLAISSDGSFIATASDDETVQLWSTKSHERIGQPLKHTCVSCVAISLSGELLASGDDDGNLQLWSIENTHSTTLGTDSSYFAHRSKVKLGQNLYTEALLDAEKVIKLNPSSCLGYQLKSTALHGAQHYDDAPDPQIRQLHQQCVSPSEVEGAIRRAFHTQMENAPLRLINTITGNVCDRDAQIDDFMDSTECKELFDSSDRHVPLQTEPIKEAVAKYFSWVMLSHKWGAEEPLLHDVQGRNIYDLDSVGTVKKLQKFCKVARDAGHRWAWSDTCCIDQNNNVELGASVNSMFTWYRYSALTIIYLSDVSPSSKSGTLANSIWNTRGWTVQEFLAPRIVLFYQADWTLYLDRRSRNHKESIRIMRELEHSTGINAQSLVDFRPGTRDAREKLRWASNRDTTREEDIAYSLFGIFDVTININYGEKRHKALGRLLQEIIAHSGDITLLHWVGRSSNFNSCLPATISSYNAQPCAPPPPSEHDMQISVSALRNNIRAVESASGLYTTLEKLNVPRFANARLQLPCIAFPLTDVKRMSGQVGARCFTYDVKANGLQDLLVRTEDKLVEISPARRTQQKFVLIRPWNRYDLELVDFTDESESVDDSESVDESESVDDELDELGDDELVTKGLRLLVRLARPFGALLLAQQRGGEYKRIASDYEIIAQLRNKASVDDLRDVRTLEIL